MPEILNPQPEKMSRAGRWARRAHLRLGRRGERLACRLLRRLGMTVLMRNYSALHGEVDIVARDGKVLCFVEVKTRRRAPRSRPIDAVTEAKKKRLIRTVRRYLRQLGSPKIAYRYDIVEIIFDRSGRRLLEARYWPQTFTEVETRERAVRRAGTAADFFARGRSES